MFCPSGYVSLAALWKEFSRKFRNPLTRVACDKYGADDFALGDEHGAPDDFCEDVFLSTLSKVPVFASSADGRVMRLEVELDGGRSKLFEKMTALESFIAASNPDEAGDENYWLRKLGSDHFEPWDPSSQKISDWKAKYLGSDGRFPEHHCFHTLPFVFERARYVITNEAPPWLDDAIDEHFLPDVTARFGGQSLCLDQQSANEWRTKVMQRQGFLEELKGQKNAKKDGGRTKLVPRALIDIQVVFPEGLDAPWKQVPEKVYEKTGNKYSESTLRRAFRQLNEK